MSAEDHPELCGDNAEDTGVEATTLKQETAVAKDVLEMTDAELLDEEKAPLTDKIRFVWRTEDESILTRIELAAEQQFQQMFGEAIGEMNRFYECLRVAERYVDGYPVWQTNEHGRYVERWDQLTGQDIEQIIMNLSRIKLYVSKEVNRLKSRAVYAKMVADDVKADVWKTVAVGTVGDRTAKANRQSRQDRYHAFFVYHVWKVADTFLSEMIDFQFRLRDVRNWRVQSQPR